MMINIRLALYVIVSSFILVINAQSAAANNALQNPVRVETNNAMREQTTGNSSYQGDVKIDQGNLHVRGDKVDAAFAADKTLDTITVFGLQARAHAWLDARDNKPPVHAYAKKIVYESKKKMLYLYDNAEIKQNSDYMKAPVIVYDIEKQKIISSAKNKQRTVILMQSPSLSDKKS